MILIWIPFIVVPYHSCVESEHAETAGNMMAFMLVIGLGAGAAFSFAITTNL